MSAIGFKTSTVIKLASFVINSTTKRSYPIQDWLKVIGKIVEGGGLLVHFAVKFALYKISYLAPSLANIGVILFIVK